MKVFHDTATECHLQYGITQCYLLPDTSEHTPALTPAIQATRITYPGGMEGWVDLVDLIAPRPGVEPATFRSRVQRSATAPTRQPVTSVFIMFWLCLQEGRIGGLTINNPAPWFVGKLSGPDCELRMLQNGRQMDFLVRFRTYIVRTTAAEYFTIATRKLRYRKYDRGMRHIWVPLICLFTESD